MQSLIEAVLEAEGISKEVLQAQRARIDLISQFAEALEKDRAADTLNTPDSALAALVAKQKAALDYEFFMTLTSYVESAEAQGRPDSAAALTELRDQLVKISGFDAVAAGLQEPEIDTVIDALLAASPEQLDETVANYRPSLDDALFDAWQTRIETLSGAEQTAARERLELIQSTVERLDQEAQQLFEAAAKLLREVLSAPEPETILRERVKELNEAFLVVIDANMAASSRGGNEQAVQTLLHIRELTMQVLQEAMTPQDRLINQLLDADTAGESTKLLRKNVALVTTDFVKHVNELVAEMEKAGRKETVERLRQIAREAASLLF